MMLPGAMLLIQRRFLPLGLSSLLALAVVWAGTPRVTLAAPGGDFEQLVAEADEHAGAGRHQEALGAYAGAFDAMPADQQAGSVGEFVALAAGKAALDAFEADQDPASLEQGRGVLERFIAAAEGAGEPTEAARARLDEIVALIPDPEPEEQTEPEIVPRDPGPSTTDAPRKGPSKTVGIALIAVGGASLLGGVGLMVAGSQQVPWYEDQLASGGWDTTSPEYRAELANAERTRDIDIGVGGALLGVGAALGVAGAVILVKARTRDAPPPVALSGGVSRQRLMVGATWRF